MSNHWRMYERYQAIYLHLQGVHVKKIAAILNQNPQTVNGRLRWSILDKIIIMLNHTRIHHAKLLQPFWSKWRSGFSLFFCLHIALSLTLLKDCGNGCDPMSFITFSILQLQTYKEYSAVDAYYYEIPFGHYWSSLCLLIIWLFIRSTYIVDLFLGISM